MNFDLPVPVNLHKLEPRYRAKSDAHRVAFGIDRDLWTKFEVPQPGLILRGILVRKGTAEVEQVSWRNFTPSFSPSVDIEKPGVNVNRYGVSVEVSPEDWARYKPLKASDYTGFLWAACDDEMDQLIVARYLARLLDEAQRAIEAEPIVDRPGKVKKEKLPKGPFGLFWQQLLIPEDKGGLGFFNHPGVRDLVQRWTNTYSAADDKHALLCSFGVHSRSQISPEQLREALDCEMKREFNLDTAIQMIETAERKAVAAGMG